MSSIVGVREDCSSLLVWLPDDVTDFSTSSRAQDGITCPTMSSVYGLVETECSAVFGDEGTRITCREGLGGIGEEPALEPDYLVLAEDTRPFLSPDLCHCCNQSRRTCIAIEVRHKQVIAHPVAGNTHALQKLRLVAVLMEHVQEEHRSVSHQQVFALAFIRRTPEDRGQVVPTCSRWQPMASL